MSNYRGPASIAMMTMLAGLALMYWALVGFGIITGATPQERYKNVVQGIKKQP